MRIAILGAGFSGLATAWYLLHHTQGAAKIDLFDPQPIGEGVSGLSSGLLHAYAGKHARLARFAEKGMDATHELITEASRAIHSSVILSKGILRPATTQEQFNDFQKCVESTSNTEWWDEKKCKQKIPNLMLLGGGLYIKNGLTIDVPTYLNGLWQAVALLGTQFHPITVTNEEKLAKYDKVVFALGHALKSFKIFDFLPIVPVKGQALELEWPENTPSLPFSLISYGYLVMNKERTKCLAGATFERRFETAEPEPEIAVPQIFSKITPFFPSLGKAKILSCRAGIRATAPSRHHLPIAGRLSQKYWYLSGLGSKGLLYHAWLGNLLAQAILTNDPTLFPKEIWFSQKDTLPPQN